MLVVEVVRSGAAKHHLNLNQHATSRQISEQGLGLYEVGIEIVAQG